MAINGSKFASLHFLLFPFYFLLFPRIGTFQRVTGEGNKKNRPLSDLALKLCSVTMSNSRSLSSPGRRPGASIPPTRIGYRLFLILSRKMSAFIAVPVGDAFREPESSILGRHGRPRT